MGLFEHEDIIQCKDFNSDNKKFRDIDRIYLKIIQNSQENLYVCRVIDKLSKEDKKKHKPSDLDLLKSYIP